MGAHQRMAGQEGGWLLNRKVHIANGGPISGLLQGRFYLSTREQGIAAEACRRHKESGNA